MRGVQLLAGGGRFDSTRGLLRWSLRVARNLLIDEWRMRERHLDPGPVPERAGPEEVGTTVEWRIALEETLAAFAHLTPTERHALAAALAPGAPIADKRARDREGLRRLRARDRLRTFVRGLPVAVPLHRLRWWVADAGVPLMGGITAASVFVTSAILMALAPTSSDRAERVSQLRAAAQTVAQPESARPAAADSTLPARSGGERSPARPHVAPSTAPPPSLPAPERVAVPAPFGGELQTYTTPNAPEKPLVCAETWATPSLCIDKPPPLVRR